MLLKEDFITPNESNQGLRFMSFTFNFAGETGIATVYGGQEEVEYQFQKWFDRVPGIVYGICGYNVDLDTRDTSPKVKELNPSPPTYYRHSYHGYHDTSYTIQIEKGRGR